MGDILEEIDLHTYCHFMLSEILKYGNFGENQHCEIFSEGRNPAYRDVLHWFREGQPWGEGWILVNSYRN